MNKVVKNIGSEKHVDVDSLSAFEAVSMSVVAVMAVIAELSTAQFFKKDFHVSKNSP